MKNVFNLSFLHSLSEVYHPPLCFIITLTPTLNKADNGSIVKVIMSWSYYVEKAGCQRFWNVLEPYNRNPRCFHMVVELFPKRDDITPNLQVI